MGGVGAGGSMEVTEEVFLEAAKDMLKVRHTDRHHRQAGYVTSSRPGPSVPPLSQRASCLFEIGH